MAKCRLKICRYNAPMLVITVGSYYIINYLEVLLTNSPWQIWNYYLAMLFTETHHVRDFDIWCASRVLLSLQWYGYHGCTRGTLPTLLVVVVSVWVRKESDRMYVIIEATCVVSNKCVMLRLGICEESVHCVRAEQSAALQVEWWTTGRGVHIPAAHHSS